jgi:thioredoxin 1
MSDSKNVHEATDVNFDAEVLPAVQLTVVDFWAPWCGPCRQLGPTIEKVADEYVGKIKVFKMNVDDNQVTPAKFQVKGIPTVIFLKNGKLVDQMVGNQSQKAITEILSKHM